MKVLTSCFFLALTALGAPTRTQAQPPLPRGTDPGLGVILTAIGALEVDYRNYETPYSIRFASYVAALWWNCVAVYSDDFEDSITKDRPAVPVLDATMHHTGNRLVCAAQAGASYSALTTPGAVDLYVGAMQSINITVDGAVDEAVLNCGYDPTCLRNIASDQGYNPITMGHIVTVLAYQVSSADGFNELGTDNGCEVNCRPYRDPTGYIPSNSPFTKAKRSSVRGQRARCNDGWEPLLEDDGLGFFYYQQHVTPHIGKLAKFRFLPESDRADRVAPPPKYSKRRIPEALAVIERMATLDDTKKIQVEVFDDKLFVDMAILGAFVGKLSSVGFNDTVFDHADDIFITPERAIHISMTLTAALHDAVIISWKEKVNYDLVRPTTIIKKLQGGNQMITTWAPGADAGSPKTFPSRDFEAYKRVMPHSEYVSGSACIFQAAEDFVVEYLSAIGVNSTEFPVGFPPIGPGASRVEPGVVPKDLIALFYPTIQDMAFAGSESRLDGGMHFDDSVPGAKELCKGIGTQAAIGAMSLIPEN